MINIDNIICSIIQKLTLKEKAELVVGKNWWQTKAYESLNIPSVFMCDGPNGIRMEDLSDSSLGTKNTFPATCFPTASCSACSWNTDLLQEMGKAMANEAKALGVNVILGPGVNIKRSPLGGRNFEYFSEDPFLSGKLGSAFITGCEKEGVGTCVKHFAVNSQEYFRMNVSENVDEKAFRELYLTPFELCIKEAHPASVMCSYNRINGTFSSDNKKLLTDILRKEWGFDGIVVSDWNATHDRVKGIDAGLDLEMPYSYGITTRKIIKAVESQELSQVALDRIVYRIIKFALTYSETKKTAYDFDISRKLARKLGNDSVVLLKNDTGLLPINKNEHITVIGELARTPRYQGAGSSKVVPRCVTSFLSELDRNSISYDFYEGYQLKKGANDKELIKKATEAAKKADKVLLFIGLTEEYESEGYDRNTMSLPDTHISLAKAVAAENKNAIVVLAGGSPVEMPFVDNVNSILMTYLPGECVGEVTFDTIFGMNNPSGKLAETFPLKQEDVLSNKFFAKNPYNSNHIESIFVGYRYFDTARKNVLFPFGHGLSYTRFMLDDVNLNYDSHLVGKEQIKVTFKITNVGDRFGAEVVQIYVKDIQSTEFVAEKSLAAFCKIYLKPMEQKCVTLTIDDKAFMYFSTKNGKWQIENGEFEILIGNSSRNILHRERIYVETLDSDIKHFSTMDTCPSYYKLSDTDTIPFDEWQKLMGDFTPCKESKKAGEFDTTCTLYDIRNTQIGKIIQKLAFKLSLAQFNNPDPATLEGLKKGIVETPLRTFPGNTHGLVGKRMIDSIVLIANKKRIRGFLLLIAALPQSASAYFRGKKEAKEARKQFKAK